MSNISGVVARVFVDDLDTAIPLYQQLAQTTAVNRFGFRDVQLAQVGPFLLLSGDTALTAWPGESDWSTITTHFSFAAPVRSPVLISSGAYPCAA
jgi:hypothetical protein